MRCSNPQTVTNGCSGQRIRGLFWLSSWGCGWYYHYNVTLSRNTKDICVWHSKTKQPLSFKKNFQTKPNEFSISFETRFSIGFYLYSPAWSYSLYCIIYNSGWSITSEYPLGCLSNLFVHLLHYQPQMCAEVVFDLFLMFQELAGEPIKRSLK